MGFDGGGLNGFLAKAKGEVGKMKDKFKSDVTSPRSQAQVADMKASPFGAAKNYMTKGTTGANEDAQLAKEAPKKPAPKKKVAPKKQADGGGGVYPEGTPPNFNPKKKAMN